VVTIANFSGALVGVDAGSIKVSDIAEFPTKGRATGGVRAHKFLKGEDQVVLAYVGENPAALGKAGATVELPATLAKRDASGTALATPISAIGFLPASND
jgi:DNA gyrase subunit A